MRTHTKYDATRLTAVFTGFLLLASVPVAVAAAPSAALRAQAVSLRAESDSIEARMQTAALELYAVETRLGRARGALAGIAARRSALERDRASIGRHLAIAQAALRSSESRLAGHLRALYQQSGTTDPLEIVLGAASLDEALTGLDGLDRAAGQSAEIIEQARAARLRLRAAQFRLASRAAELRQLGAAAEAEANELAAAVAERKAYLAGLRHRQGLNATRIAAIEAEARAAGARTAALPPVARTAASTPAATVAPVRAPAAGTTLTVTSTGYALRGRTSSGMAAGPGVVAVDPSVIPLGTRMTVPGYGEAIAADTGGAVIGNTIDLWFPTLEQARRWGRRTVTVTLG